MFSLGKGEKLKSKKLIGELYAQGKSVKEFPLKLVFLKKELTTEFPAQMGVTVSKRNFKRAVDRNRIKRLIRESYRSNKPMVYQEINSNYIFMISYLAREEWDFDKITIKMKTLLKKFTQEIKKHE